MDKIKLQEPQVYFWVVAQETPETLSSTGHLISMPPENVPSNYLCCEQSHLRQWLEKHASNP